MWSLAGIGGGEAVREVGGCSDQGMGVAWGNSISCELVGRV